MIEPLFTAKKCETTLNYLLRRRSCPMKFITEPGPSNNEIQTILTVASRVPDHGKLFPWYFIVISGDNKQKLASLLRDTWKKEDPKATDAKLQLEYERFNRAPVIIVVVSKIREGKAPVWEQILSAGAATQNLILAASCLGYASNWVTEWYTYSKAFRQLLGVSDNENIAGFVYIGSKEEEPMERDRPELENIVTYWTPQNNINKGDNYGRKAIGLPKLGFSFSIEE
jgi:nitroreductase